MNINLNPFTAIGGLVSDTIEVAKIIGNSITDIPSDISKGYDKGLVIDNHPKPKKPVVKKTTKPVRKPVVKKTTK